MLRLQMYNLWFFPVKDSVFGSAIEATKIRAHSDMVSYNVLYIFCHTRPDPQRHAKVWHTFAMHADRSPEKTSQIKCVDDTHAQVPLFRDP